MRIADVVDYEPLKVIEQVGGTCSAHAFFVALSEIIQQETNTDIDFDLYAEYDNMLKEKGDKSGYYIEHFMKIGQQDGFITTDGAHRVFIDDYARIGKDKDTIAEYLQQYGPLVFGVNTYRGHSLVRSNADGFIYNVPESSEKQSKHVMLCRGHLNRKGFKFQNSWGGGKDRNVKYMNYETWKKMTRYVFCIKKIRIVDNLTPIRMQRLSQRNPIWAAHKIGKTKFTIGKLGCTITSICMIHSKFYRNYIKPHEAAGEWKFDSRGRIFWTSSDFTGMTFRWRGYANDKEVISEYANDPKKGVIVEVGYKHWIAVGPKSILGLQRYYDSWDGTWFYKGGLKKKYGRITGYALFEKTS